jgi:hypothetical protein
LDHYHKPHESGGAASFLFPRHRQAAGHGHGGER